MSDDLVALSRSAQELEPAVREFASAVGRLGPVQELVQWIADEIRYRREPRKAAILIAAAEQVRRSGLPARAVEDRLLRTVLEEGSLEDHPDMRDRWSNLLANDLISDSKTHVAFPGLLAQISPVEARMLDAMYNAMVDELAGRDRRGSWFHGFAPVFFVERVGLSLKQYPTAAKNLDRVGLADKTGWMHGPTVLRGAGYERISDAINLSHFGAEFVLACSPPGLSRAVVELRIEDG